MFDKGVLDVLQGLLAGTRIGAGGRDQQQFGQYTRLKLAGAWRVANKEMWGVYQHSRRKVEKFCFQRHLRGGDKASKARIQSKLYQCSAKLPGEEPTKE